MSAQLPVFTLVREASSNDGTLGEILNPDGSHLCYTCELPGQNNAPDVSCIPLGSYGCIPHDSAAHRNVWELQNVPNRIAILIHNGNTENDSLGCIVVGSQQGTLGGLPAVLNSNATLAMLQQTLPPNFTLVVS